MDFISISPSDDDLYSPHQVGPIHFPFTIQPTPARVVGSDASVPGPGKRRTVPSAVHIPHGSSLLNIQSQYHSSDDSSVSPSPPPQRVEEEQPQVTGNSRRQPRPTPSPTRPTSINTRSRTQRHHAPARSPGRQTTPNISDWTVASLQKAPRDKGIPFHRTDNKANFSKSSRQHAARAVPTAASPPRVTSSRGAMAPQEVTKTGQHVFLRPKWDLPGPRDPVGAPGVPPRPPRWRIAGSSSRLAPWRAASRLPRHLLPARGSSGGRSQRRPALGCQRPLLPQGNNFGSTIGGVKLAAYLFIYLCMYYLTIFSCKSSFSS